MQVKLRAIKESDVNKIAWLESVCFRASWSEEMILSALKREDFCGVFAEADGEFAGYLLGSSLYEIAEVSRVAVCPDKRHMGVGKTILQSFSEQVARLGAEKVFLEVRVSNLGAIKLYEREGFTCVRVRKKYYEHTEDALEMMKEL